MRVDRRMRLSYAPFRLLLIFITSFNSSRCLPSFLSLLFLDRSSFFLLSPYPLSRSLSDRCYHSFSFLAVLSVRKCGLRPRGETVRRRSMMEATRGQTANSLTMNCSWWRAKPKNFTGLKGRRVYLGGRGRQEAIRCYKTGNRTVVHSHACVPTRSSEGLWEREHSHERCSGQNVYYLFADPSSILYLNAVFLPKLLLIFSLVRYYQSNRECAIIVRLSFDSSSFVFQRI